MLELIEGEEVNDLFENIKEGRMTAEDFDNISDPSLIWGAIIKGFEATSIFTVSNTNVSTDDVVHRLSDSYKRACGPLICTTELLLEYFPHNSAVIVSSLQKAFISPMVLGHSNATSFLLHLVEDYKMYFPYTYTFCRRIGKSPNVTLQDWKDTFYPSASSNSVQDKGSGKKGNGSGGGDLNTSGIQDFSLDNWDMSGLEEGEDSDDDRCSAPPLILSCSALICSNCTALHCSALICSALRFMIALFFLFLFVYACLSDYVVHLCVYAVLFACALLCCSPALCCATFLSLYLFVYHLIPSLFTSVFVYMCTHHGTAAAATTCSLECPLFAPRKARLVCAKNPPTRPLRRR
jgi:hypothetical protein